MCPVYPRGSDPDPDPGFLDGRAWVLSRGFELDPVSPDPDPKLNIFSCLQMMEKTSKKTGKAMALMVTQE